MSVGGEELGMREAGWGQLLYVSHMMLLKELVAEGNFPGGRATSLQLLMRK